MLKIFRTGAVLNHQVTKEVSQISARKVLEDNIRQEKAKADGKTAFAYGINKQEARKNQKKWTKDYERTLPETLSPEAQNAMWKRAKQLKDEFIQGMLSHAELHPVKGFNHNGTMNWVVDEQKMREYNTVDRQKKWDDENKERVSEFKNIMRHLEPDNPKATDVEKYRPKLRNLK